MKFAFLDMDTCACTLLQKNICLFVCDYIHRLPFQRSSGSSADQVSLTMGKHYLTSHSIASHTQPPFPSFYRTISCVEGRRWASSCPTTRRAWTRKAGGTRSTWSGSRPCPCTRSPSSPTSTPCRYVVLCRMSRLVGNSVHTFLKRYYIVWELGDHR
jgi:hypothetical protein